jgi:hypothetical protein
MVPGVASEQGRRRWLWRLLGALIVVAGTTLVGVTPAWAKTCSAYGTNNCGAEGFVAAPDYSFLYNVNGFSAQAIVPSDMDEPTTCGAQATPVRCGDNQNDVITGANLRPLQLRMRNSVTLAFTGDFIGWGYGKGCLRAGMNYDPMGHCSGINSANGGVYTRVYADGSAGGYYNQNWYDAVSQGNTLSFVMGKHSLTDPNSVWDLWFNGRLVTTAAGQSGYVQADAGAGSESATSGTVSLSMTEAYFQTMTARLTSSGGSWYTVSTMSAFSPDAGCSATWLSASKQLWDQGRC